MKKIFFLLIITIFSLSACQQTTAKNTKTIKLQKPADNQIYFGAFPDFGGPEDEVSKKRIEDFEDLVGKKIAWAYFSQNWYDGIIYPKQAIASISSAGTVPFVRLMARSDEIQNHSEQKFSLQHIIDGNFDKELIAWARACKKDDIPILIDFAVEANGDWFPWSGVFNGGSKLDGYGDSHYPDGPERYRDAYRYIIDIFRAENVNNVTWFFHFNLAPFPDKPWNQAKNYYPGDDYIDWIGFSLYGAQTLSEEWDGLDFSYQLKEHYKSIFAVTNNKPVALLEFGVTDHHPEGSKADWLNDAFKTIVNNPYVKFSAISAWHESWENEDGTMTTIKLDSSKQSLDTVQKWLSEKQFISTLKFK